MAAVRVSGNVTIDDQCAYIKIETLRGKTPTEIHSSLMEVCGVETVDWSTISRFREGRLSIENDPKSGWPWTSTKVWNVCSKSWRKTVEWHVKKLHIVLNFASICLPHFDWTLARTSNCCPVGSAWPQWGTKVSTRWNCTTIVAQISWRRERISAKVGCYWRNLDPGFRTWASGEAKVPRDRKNLRGSSRTWNKWWFSHTIVKVWSW